MVSLDRPASTTYQWPVQGEWTYADYARLPDSEWRYEVIRGELHMSPAPSVAHQEVSLLLVVAIHNFVQAHNLGRVLEAPLDVILPGLASPVQPDIVFIGATNADIIKAANIEGVPDLIVEILSPSTAQHDRHTKYRLYAEAGVTEYWIVDPDACTVDVYALRGRAYVPFGHFERGGVVESELVEGLRVAVSEICRS